MRTRAIALIILAAQAYAGLAGRAAAQCVDYADYLNWQRGLPIADGFFEPEPGVKIETLELEAYNRLMAKDGSVGPIPILYADLLHGKRERFGEDE